MRILAGLVALACIACGTDDTRDPPPTPTASGGGTTVAATGGGTTTVAMGGAGGAGGAAGGEGGSTGTATFDVITERHRFDPGKMFGGWGPHLGHLVRSGDALWFVDDHCAQAPGPGTVCDVLDNHTLGYFEHTPAGWIERHTVALPGAIQQNTATIVDPVSGELQTFGIDSGAATLHMCRYDVDAGPIGCSALPFTLSPSSNYVGAAVSPAGYRMVWWTGVVDGGGGSFHYIVDYGGGWNGPRSGDAGGYNDASYINIAFGGAQPNDFTMHVQLVSGLAPSWSFHGAVGYGDLGTANPVTWSLALAPPGGDAVVSTNDIWTDPATGDTHLVARLESGAAAYYHRPAGSAWSAALFQLPATYRARFLYAADDLVLIYGPNAGGLAYRVAGDRSAGEPIDWEALPEATPDVLPNGFGRVLAIYPESPAYQTTPSSGLHVAVVGDGAEHVAGHVHLAP